MQEAADPGRGGRDLLKYGPGGYRVPGVAIHTQRWLSRALHTTRVRAWQGAKRGTARRLRWYAGGGRMGCRAAAVIHLHVVSGTIAPHSTVPMSSA